MTHRTPMLHTFRLSSQMRKRQIETKERLDKGGEMNGLSSQMRKRQIETVSNYIEVRIYVSLSSQMRKRQIETQDRPQGMPLRTEV